MTDSTSKPTPTPMRTSPEQDATRNSTSDSPSNSTTTTTTTTTISFDKHKAYVPYCSNDKNTTIGMPRLAKKVDGVIKEKSALTMNTEPPSLETETDTLSPASQPTGQDYRGNLASFYRGSLASLNLSSRSILTTHNNYALARMRERAMNARAMMASVSSEAKNELESADYSLRSNDTREPSIASGTVMQFYSIRRFSQSERKRIAMIMSERHEQKLEMDASRDIVNVELNVNDYRDVERIALSEDVYSFIFACSYRSLPFIFAITGVGIKYVCYCFLIASIEDDPDTKQTWKVQFVKAFLIPVAVAMQDDLMTVFFNIANIKYDGTVAKKDAHATHSKWILANSLRCIDGMLSLTANVFVMIMTKTITDVTLNFAALHFLQFIDDAFYGIAEKGFLSDRFEGATLLCKHITLPRRTSKGSHLDELLTAFDTLFLIGIISVCLVAWLIVFVNDWKEEMLNAGNEIMEKLGDAIDGSDD